MASKIGITPPNVERGEQWFRALPKAKQRQYMGPAMHDAFSENAFSFNDLSKPYDDPIYGEMVREASLQDLLGNQAKRYYTNR